MAFPTLAGLAHMGLTSADMLSGPLPAASGTKGSSSGCKQHRRPRYPGHPHNHTCLRTQHAGPTRKEGLCGCVRRRTPCQVLVVSSGWSSRPVLPPGQASIRALPWLSPKQLYLTSFIHWIPHKIVFKKAPEGSTRCRSEQATSHCFPQYCIHSLTVPSLPWVFPRCLPDAGLRGPPTLPCPQGSWAGSRQTGCCQAMSLG